MAHIIWPLSRVRYLCQFYAGFQTFCFVIWLRGGLEGGGWRGVGEGLWRGWEKAGEGGGEGLAKGWGGLGFYTSKTPLNKTQ